MLTSVFVGSHAVNECLHRSSLARPIGRFTAPEALLQRAASLRCRRRKWDFMSHSSSLSASLPPYPCLHDSRTHYAGVIGGPGTKAYLTSAAEKPIHYRPRPHPPTPLPLPSTKPSTATLRCVPKDHFHLGKRKGRRATRITTTTTKIERYISSKQRSNRSAAGGIHFSSVTPAP